MSEWQAYYTLEPWGEERADLRAGIVASTTANVNRGKNATPFKPSDFMPEFNKPEREPQTVEQQIAAAKAWVLAMGGTINGQHR